MGGLTSPKCRCGHDDFAHCLEQRPHSPLAVETSVNDHAAYDRDTYQYWTTALQNWRMLTPISLEDDTPTASVIATLSYLSWNAVTGDPDSLFTSGDDLEDAGSLFMAPTPMLDKC